MISADCWDVSDVMIDMPQAEDSEDAYYTNAGNTDVLSDGADEAWYDVLVFASIKVSQREPSEFMEE